MRYHSPLRTVVGFVLLTLASVSCAGCGSNADITAVSGVVKLDGQPMPDARVVFAPDSSKGTHGLMSSAVTDAEGHFSLVCQDKRNGAAVGTHRVTIQDVRSLPRAVSDATPVRPPPPKPSRVASIYGDVTKTPLILEVKAGQEPLTLEVKGK